MKAVVWFVCLILAGAVARADMPAISKEFEAYMLAHHYVAAGLESGGTNEQWIRARVNGKPVVLAVDTGSPRTSLTIQCARSLGLDIHDTGHTTGGLGGEIKGNEGIALMQSFQLPFGDINRTNTIMILPKKADLGWELDGLFGLDFLELNAAIYPIGGHGILFKPGPSPPVSITDYMTKIGFRAVPLLGGGGHIWVEGHINGMPMKFIVDSGAFVSDFRLSSVHAALREDIGSTILPIAGLDGKRATSFGFTPKSMDIGGFDVSHESFLASEETTFEQDHFDGLVGVDLLGSHSAVVDLGGHTLWMR